MSNALLLTVCPFSWFLFSIHLQVLATTDTGVERPLFLYGNTFNRLPPMRLLRLTTAAGTDPTPPLGRSRWTGKQAQNPFSPLGFSRRTGLSQAPTNNTVTSVRLIHTVQNTIGPFQNPTKTTLKTAKLLQSRAGADQQRSHEGVERLEHNPTFYVRNLPHPHT